MKLPTRKIVRLVKVHLGAFDYKLDPIGLKSLDSRIASYQFVIALFTILLFPFYGTLVLEYESMGCIEWASLPNSPYLYMHQMGSVNFRSQLDVALAIDTIACVCVYAILAFQPQIDDKFKLKTVDTGLRLKIGSQVLSKQVSSRMAIFGQRTKYTFRYIIASLYLFTLVYFLVQVWLNSVYTRTVQSFVLWLVVFPLYWFYIVYGAYASILVVLMASGYVHIWQQSILDWLSLLNGHLRRHQLGPQRLTICWNGYLKVNHTVVQLCGVIQAYSRHCEPFLTVMMPFYVVLQCYFGYIVFLVDSSSFLAKQHYFYALLVLEAFLFSLIYQCSRVVKANQAILRENRRFFLFYQKQLSFRKQTSQLLKAELLQTPRILNKYAFRVASFHRITMNTFNLIISYIVALFLLLIKNQRE